MAFLQKYLNFVAVACFILSVFAPDSVTRASYLVGLFMAGSAVCLVVHMRSGKP